MKATKKFFASLLAMTMSLSVVHGFATALAMESADKQVATLSSTGDAPDKIIMFDDFSAMNGYRIETPLESGNGYHIASSRADNAWGAVVQRNNGVGTVDSILFGVTEEPTGNRSLYSNVQGAQNSAGTIRIGKTIDSPTDDLTRSFDDTESSWRYAVNFWGKHNFGTAGQFLAVRLADVTSTPGSPPKSVTTNHDALIIRHNELRDSSTTGTNTFNSYTQTAKGTTINVNNWNYYSVVVDANKWTKSCYVNGELVFDNVPISNSRPTAFDSFQVTLQVSYTTNCSASNPMAYADDVSITDMFGESFSYERVEGGGANEVLVQTSVMLNPDTLDPAKFIFTKDGTSITPNDAELVVPTGRKDDAVGSSDLKNPHENIVKLTFATAPDPDAELTIEQGVEDIFGRNKVSETPKDKTIMYDDFSAINGYSVTTAFSGNVGYINTSTLINRNDNKWGDRTANGNSPFGIIEETSNQSLYMHFTGSVSSSGNRFTKFVDIAPSSVPGTGDTAWKYAVNFWAKNDRDNNGASNNDVSLRLFHTGGNGDNVLILRPGSGALDGRANRSDLNDSIDIKGWNYYSVYIDVLNWTTTCYVNGDLLFKDSAISSAGMQAIYNRLQLGFAVSANSPSTPPADKMYIDDVTMVDLKGDGFSAEVVDISGSTVTVQTSVMLDPATLTNPKRFKLDNGSTSLIPNGVTAVKTVRNPDATGSSIYSNPSDNLITLTFGETVTGNVEDYDVLITDTVRDIGGRMAHSDLRTAFSVAEDENGEAYKFYSGTPSNGSPATNTDTDQSYYVEVEMDNQGGDTYSGDLIVAVFDADNDGVLVDVVTKPFTVAEYASPTIITTDEIDTTGITKPFLKAFLWYGDGDDGNGINGLMSPFKGTGYLPPAVQ